MESRYRDREAAARKQAIEFGEKAAKLEAEHAKMLELLRHGKSFVDEVQAENEKYKKIVDKFLASDSYVSLTMAAKILGVSPRKFSEFLKAGKFISKSNIAFQKYIDEGIFVVRSYEVDSTRFKQQTMVTPKGQKFFGDLMETGEMAA
jgi:phage antirepressor YoqD-like protein